MNTVGTQEDKKKLNQLYPSLPNPDRWEGVQLHQDSAEKLNSKRMTHCKTCQAEISTLTDNAMKAQLVILGRQRKELLAINTKWADQYELMIRYYKEKVREQHFALLSKPNEEMPGKGDEQNIKERDLKARTNAERVPSRTDDVSDELLKAEQETERLRTQNTYLTNRGQHQREEIRRLNQALQDTLESTLLLGEISGKQDNMWKHQAEVYKEDFLKERMDRERLNAKFLELEKRYRRVHAELHMHKSKGTWTRVFPQPSNDCNRNQANPPRRDPSTVPRS